MNIINISWQSLSNSSAATFTFKTLPFTSWQYHQHHNHYHLLLSSSILPKHFHFIHVWHHLYSVPHYYDPLSIIIITDVVTSPIFVASSHYYPPSYLWSHRHLLFWLILYFINDQTCSGSGLWLNVFKKEGKESRWCGYGDRYSGWKNKNNWKKKRKKIRKSKLRQVQKWNKRKQLKWKKKLEQ